MIFTICKTVATRQYAKYKNTATPTPKVIIGKRKTSKQIKATANVPPNTVIALSNTSINELETKATKTMKGKDPRIVQMTRKREIRGWFCINSLLCKSR